MSTPDRVLMTAFHFPPLAGSSGIQRTLRFVQHLPRFGWTPAVLSANPRAYDRTSNDLMTEVPADVVVERAFALDTQRHLSIKGRYVGAMARPDRWVSWRFDAVRRGMRMIAALAPRAIWSTYPIATAHLIAAELHRRSGLPWIADFRDPMAQDGYPADPVTWQQYSDIESHAALHASFCVFTTPGAARVYRERYPQAAERIVVIENGYDEESFASAEASRPETPPLHPGRITLLHSGIIYPKERDPTQLFVALQRLKAEGRIAADSLTLRFRAAVHDDLLHSLAAQHDISDLIETLPPVPYEQALHEMRCADALLVMQASDCNEQIPGKLYEYLRAGRPIVCLADPVGDTAGLVRDSGIRDIAPLDSADAIAGRLMALVDAVRAGTADLPTAEAVGSASRRGRTALLAGFLDRSTKGGR